MHRIVLLHVAKTAGTAVQSLLRSCFAPSCVIIRAEAGRANGFASISREMDTAQFISGHICYQEARDLCGDADWRLGITLRDPIARTLSNLRYYVGLPRHRLSGEFLAVRERLEVEPFHEYLRRLSSPLEIHNFVNLQTRFLLDFVEPSRPLQPSDLELAKRRLASIDHLFLTEELEASVQLFCQETGIPERLRLPPTNTEASERRLARRAHTALSPELQGALEAVNSLDLELWNFALELLRERRAAHSGSSADTARAEAGPSDAAASAPYTIELTDGPGSGWHWTGFDYGVWSSSEGGGPQEFRPGRLLDVGEEVVAWVVQSPASLRLTVPAGGSWQASIDLVAWVSFRSLIDLRIRVDGQSVTHSFALEANGSPSVSFLLPPGPPGMRKIDIETAPRLYLDEFSAFPGMGLWVDLPRASVAIRRVRVSAAPADLPAQSPAERVRLLSTMRGALERTFDLRPEEIASLLPEVTAADYADPAARHAVARHRNEADRERLEWQSPSGLEPSPSGVPAIGIALDARTGQVVSGCLLRDLPAGADCVGHFLPGEAVPNQVALVIVDSRTGQCIPSVDADRHEGAARRLAP